MAVSTLFLTFPNHTQTHLHWNTHTFMPTYACTTHAQHTLNTHINLQPYSIPHLFFHRYFWLHNEFENLSNYAENDCSNRKSNTTVIVCLCLKQFSFTFIDRSRILNLLWIVVWSTFLTDEFYFFFIQHLCVSNNFQYFFFVESFIYISWIEVMKLVLFI